MPFADVDTSNVPLSAPYSAIQSIGQLYAWLDTSHGPIAIELAEVEAPKTVRAFAGLATGALDWTDPRAGLKRSGVPFYDGTIFHRVVPGFIIQGGDRAGNGSGGPGFTFADECGEMKHRSEDGTGTGIVSMANFGRPNTNGSQFFITVSERPLPQLDGKFSVFGRVVRDPLGRFRANAIDISTVGVSWDNRPTSDVLLRSVKVYRSNVPPDPTKTFERNLGDGT